MNELLSKELNNLKDKIIRLKDAYLNEIISLRVVLVKIQNIGYFSGIINIS